MSSDDIWDPLHAIWGTPAWPPWMTNFRPHQRDAIADIVEHFSNGVDLVICNAPTGAGKTVIAEGVRKLIEPKHATYIANTKTLQDQFVQDFPYARMLKGRANYPTADHPEKFVDGFGHLDAADCTKAFVELPACNECYVPDDDNARQLHCDNCHPVGACGYEKALDEAMAAPVCVTNTAYFLTEANGPGKFSSAKKNARRPGQFVVVDECDTLEPILMGLIETYISDRQREKYGIPFPDKKTVRDTWLPWVKGEAQPRISQLRKAIEVRYAERRLNADGTSTLIWDRSAPIDKKREHRKLSGLEERLRYLAGDLTHNNAVFDGYQRGDILFKPVKVDAYGPRMVWRHGEKWLLMSATVIDPLDLVQSLGIDKAELQWEVVDVPSTFPAENRPIHVNSYTDMTYKNKDVAWPQMAQGINSVLEKHRDARVLVHTVSYSLAEYLLAEVRDRWKCTSRPLMTYKGAQEREGVLEEFRKSPGAVLFAPSMDRGVDLPGDDCEVIIVAKVPFANTSDKQVNARSYAAGGKTWYAVQTIRKLVQMTGRGVRSETDTCDIYILDGNFRRKVWGDYKRLLPAWWTEAIDWSGGDIGKPKKVVDAPEVTAR